MSGKRRLAVMAQYDPRGELGPHVRRQVEALAEGVDDLLVVSTSKLTDASRQWLRERGELLERANFGYDFFSYKTGMETRDLQQYDEVVICNDSYVGPFVPYADIFATMDERPVDFWGLTRCDRHAPHVQSFFVAFRPWVTSSHAFASFWGGMTPLSDRTRVIARYEVGMSQSLVEAGFRFGSFFNETDADLALGRRRMEWWAAHRSPYPPIGYEADDVRAVSAEPWNPSTAFADRAFDGGRMPFIKIDTLRYDPYRLDSAKLLALGEEHLAGHFDGVRAFLDETSTFYPPREEGLYPTPAALLPTKPTVEYHYAS